MKQFLLPITALALAITPDLSAATSAARPSPRDTARPTRTTTTSAGSPRRGQTAPTLRGVDGAVLGTGGSTIDATLGGQFSAFGAGPATSVGPQLAPGVYPIHFDDPGTGWAERILIGVPDVPQSPAPLLVAFHGYGNSEADILVNTTFFEKAMARGWYVIAPLGAHKFHFNVPYAQANTDYALRWATQLLDIDPTRIYGVGFSMGGGSAMTYAARHMDPSGPMFAAVVNHTGTVSVSHVYDNSVDTSLLEDPLMFGGSPTQYPFRYSQASVVDIDNMTLTVDANTDLAQNLEFVPVHNYYATQDPLAHLRIECDVVDSWLTNTLGYSSQLDSIPGTQHTWNTIDEDTVLDWLSQYTLQIPTSGTHHLTADRDARWLHFDLQQDVPEQLSHWRWNIDPALNRVVIDQGVNLKRITVHTDSAGLDTTQPLSVIVGAPAGEPEEIAIAGYPQMPTNVVRAGQSTSSWTWDPQTQTVVLFESDASSYPTWTVQP